MKRSVKLIGIIALIAIIGFVMAACDSSPGSGNSGNNDTPAPLVFTGTADGQPLEITISRTAISRSTFITPQVGDHYEMIHGKTLVHKGIITAVDSVSGLCTFTPDADSPLKDPITAIVNKGEIPKIDGKGTGWKLVIVSGPWNDVEIDPIPDPVDPPSGNDVSLTGTTWKGTISFNSSLDSMFEGAVVTLNYTVVFNTATTANIAQEQLVAGKPELNELNSFDANYENRGNNLYLLGGGQEFGPYPIVGNRITKFDIGLTPGSGMSFDLIKQ